MSNEDLTKETPWLEPLTGGFWRGMRRKGEECLSTTRVGVGVLVTGLGRMDSGIWWFGR